MFGYTFRLSILIRLTADRDDVCGTVGGSMIDARVFDELAENLGKLLPPGVASMKSDFETNAKAIWALHEHVSMTRSSVNVI